MEPCQTYGYFLGYLKYSGLRYSGNPENITLRTTAGIICLQLQISDCGLKAWVKGLGPQFYNSRPGVRV